MTGHCYWIKNSIDKQWDAIRKQLKIMTASLPCTCDSLGAKTSPCKDTSACHLKQNFTEFCVAGRAALSVVYTAAGGRTAGGGGSCQRCRLLLFHRSDHLGFELPTHQHTFNCRQYEWKLVKGCYSLIYMKSHIDQQGHQLQKIILMCVDEAWFKVSLIIGRRKNTVILL